MHNGSTVLLPTVALFPAFRQLCFCFLLWYFIVYFTVSNVCLKNLLITVIHVIFEVCWKVVSIFCKYAYTPWSIKKRATFIFSITLANIDGFS